MTQRQWLRNASLLVAAPELLEACKVTERLICSCGREEREITVGEVMELIPQLRAAIAKAEGR